jgi:hypothetical protein
VEKRVSIYWVLYKILCCNLWFYWAVKEANIFLMHEEFTISVNRKKFNGSESEGELASEGYWSLNCVSTSLLPIKTQKSIKRVFLFIYASNILVECHDRSIMTMTLGRIIKLYGLFFIIFLLVSFDLFSSFSQVLSKTSFLLLFFS